MSHMYMLELGGGLSRVGGFDADFGDYGGFCLLCRVIEFFYLMNGDNIYWVKILRVDDLNENIEPMITTIIDSFQFVDERRKE
ncbi:MAG TPA: hypothetical protein VLL52_18430 [Anaerolineae bacterium]|nr:hypothetical protein [Anaerolineae bacterium]